MMSEPTTEEDEKNLAELRELTGKLMPQLAGRHAAMQANVLVSMTITWLMGFTPKGARPGILLDFLRALVTGYAEIAAKDIDEDDDDDDQETQH